MKERRFLPDEAKFATQAKVSGAIIFIMAAVIANLCWRGSVADMKEVYNTLLPFFGIVIGFWIGSSKGAADTREQLNKMMLPEGPRTIVNAPSDASVTTTEPTK